MVAAPLSIATLEATAQKLGAAASLKVIAGADHFFGGYESTLVVALTRGLQGA